MKRIQQIILFLILVPASLLAQVPDSLYFNAEKAYDEGRYDQAADAYQKILASGVEAPEIYYNLGNAYFKLNNIPAAILNYERARKLDPNDESILFNLELANSRIIDKIEPVPELFYLQWWKNVRERLSVDGWALLSILLFLAAIIMLAVFFLTRTVWLRKTGFWSAVFLLFFTSVFMLMASQKYRSITEQDEAIIFTPTITVKSSPNQNSVDLFVIHEGTKVKILDQLSGWSEIRIADGSVGWLESKHFQNI